MRRALKWAAPSNKGAGIASLLALTLIGAGCTSAPRAQFPTVESALGQLQSQTACSRAIQGEADLIASGAFVKIRGKMLYIAQAKERVRFDLYSSFGVTLSTLTSDGEKFALYSLDQRSFWYGPARTCNLERFTRVSVPPFALVELLRGRPPVLAHSDAGARIRYARPLFSRGRYVIELDGEHQTHQRIELGIPEEDFGKPLAEQRVRLLSVEVEQGGRLLYEVVLADHAPGTMGTSSVTPEEAEMGVSPLPLSGPSCAAELPGSLTFSVPDTGYKLRIDNREAVHNPPIVPDVFQQPVPSGVRSEHSDCQD